MNTHIILATSVPIALVMRCVRLKALLVSFVLCGCLPGCEQQNTQDADILPARSAAHTLSMDPIVVGLDVQEPELLAFLETMQQAAHDAPESAAARGQLGMAYAANGFDEAAADSFAQAARLDPREMRWPYYRAISLSEGGRTAAALEALDSAIDIDDSYSAAWLLRGAWMLEIDRAQAATDAYSRALELATNPATKIVAKVGVSRALMRLDRADEAVALLESVAEVSDHPYVRQMLGDAYRRAGRVDYARRIAQSGRSDPLAWPDELRAARLSFVRGFSGRMFIAKQMLGENRAPDALAILEPLRAAHPEDRDLLNNLSLAYNRLGRAQDSFDVLQVGLRTHPNFHAFHFNIAVHYENRGDPDRALEHLDRALSLDPGALEAHQGKVNLLMRAQEFDRALLAVEEFVRYGQADPDVLFSAGMIAGALEEWTLAVERFQQVLMLDPDHRRAHVFLARSLTGAARYDEAHEVLDEADRVGSDPDDVAAARRHLELLEGESR